MATKGGKNDVCYTIVTIIVSLLPAAITLTSQHAPKWGYCSPSLSRIA